MTTHRTSRAGLAPLLIAATLLGGCLPAIQRYEILDPAKPFSGHPGQRWLRHPSPEAAGWSAEQLALARAHSKTIGSSAVLVVQHGLVVDAWGDTEQRILVHSVRKSLLSALFGIAVERGAIDLNKTLAELGIDDEPPLTEQERSARVIDLLRSRSGIYHPAAAEPKSMKDGRPERGSQAPGARWWYNNWDFNALGTIFETLTGQSVFEAFLRQIAGPTGMERFRLEDGFYQHQPQLSIHKAYHFRMTANDLARFGLLFLRRGNWQRQIVPGAWVEESTRVHSETGRKNEGYGYMWWIGVPAHPDGLTSFSALGWGGHVLMVIPDEGIVVVHRVGTESGNRTSGAQWRELIRLILEARPPRGEPVSLRR